MRVTFGSTLTGTMVAATIFVGATLEAVTPVMAGQPWHCICNGQDKRFVASTRHCEYQMGVPRGKSCTEAQWRRVYRPACAEMGCQLPPLN